MSEQNTQAVMRVHWAEMLPIPIPGPVLAGRVRVLRSSVGLFVSANDVS
jgi:hypothetical protein